MIGHSQSNAIGQRIEILFAHQPHLIEAYGSVTQIHTELVFTDNDSPGYYDLRISPVYNRRQRLVARVVVVRDITAQKLAEEAERKERQLAEALRDVAVALNSTLDPRENLLANSGKR